MRRGILKKLENINLQKEAKCRNEYISSYLKLSSLTGKVGLIGILLTGITLTVYLPYYSLFDFSSNHWLAAKQIVMAVIVLLVGIVYMKRTKELKSSLTRNSEDSNDVSEKIIKLVQRVGIVSNVINMLVLLNFFFAITHRFFAYG
ncbi:MAG: hypothetical protein FJ213_09060 [Ignavibacteria bacterium]|nr:hypothetical protein [Ignavibacteria bacterium]